ncbi:MAG: helix-turn-helix transcriptional regulator, partial [Taibaiella sp.]|nr:helix-turn-helix transcriptional regulator [Taibaiella sp.]
MINETSYIQHLLTAAFSGEEIINLKELLDKKMLEYDLSKTKVISLLDIDKNTFNDIINGNAKQPTLINVIKIAEFLEVDHNKIINTIISNQNSENIGSIEKARNASFIAKNFDIKKLTKIGFFQESDGIDFLINRVLGFFDYNSIYEYETQLAIPL